ncbi:MAG: ribonuclease HI [Sulfuricurvum sp.]|nr:ribonuclease HI [Sulfuricurvum sp.]
MEKVEIYTDGSCLGNGNENNFGGYCGIVKYLNKNEQVVVGGEINTTNNKMELMAIIESIKAIPSKCEITIHSDSKITVDAINIWIKGWIKNNWKTSDKKIVANKDLWEKYLVVSQQHQVKAEWVKGHSGNKYNELCNAKAVQEAKKLQNENSKGEKISLFSKIL